MNNQQMNKTMVCVRIVRHSGDKIRIKLPLRLLRLCAHMHIDLKRSSLLRFLDPEIILALASNGNRGKIIDETTPEGDKVEVVIQ